MKPGPEKPRLPVKRVIYANTPDWRERRLRAILAILRDPACTKAAKRTDDPGPKSAA